jgi:hypothetical protein
MERNGKINEKQMDILTELQEIRKEIWKVFGVSSTKELQEKYREAVESSELINFSGKGLKKRFIEPMEQNFDFELLSEAVYEFLEIVLNDKQREIVALVDQEAQNALSEFYKIFGENIKDSHRGASFRAKQSKRGVISSNNFSDIIREVFSTEEMTKNFRKYVESRFPKMVKDSKDFSTKNIQAYLDSQKDAIGGTFIYTQKQKASEIKDKITKDKMTNKELEQTNEKIIEYYVNGSGLTKSEDNIFLKKIFQEVLAKEKTAFYVGESTTQVTGLLGEVRAMFFLKKMFSNTGVDISWVGGTRTGSKAAQPHRDLIMKIGEKRQLGVQVKNSTNEITDYYSQKIDFWSKNADTFMRDLKTDIFPGGEAWENVFLNYFGTMMFNIPYTVKLNGNKKRYVPSSAAESTTNGSLFNTKRSELLNQATVVNKLLSIFATSFLYASLCKDLKEYRDLNAIYLIGSSGILTAADIIEDILRNFTNGTNETNPVFKVTAKYKDKGSHNIVDLLNNRISFQEKKAKAVGNVDELLKLEKEETAYNKGNILKDITLTANFSFSNNLVRL